MSKLWRSLSDEQQAAMDDNHHEPDYENAGEQASEAVVIGDLWVFTIKEEQVIQALIHKEPQAMWVIDVEEYKDAIYSTMWKIIRESEIRTNAIDVEIDRLKQRKDACKKYIEQAKECLMMQFAKDGKRKHETAIYSISLRNKPASVGVVDVSKLEPRFIRTKQEPDRVAILKHFKETGEVVSGVEISTNQQTIVIK